MASATASVYPSDRAADVVLRDGSTVHVRPVRSSDRNGLDTFYRGLSEDSIWLRFFSVTDLSWAVRWALDVDYVDRFGLVAEAGLDRTIVAHGAYVRLDEHRAEVAFVVADGWQQQGIATILLAHLAEVATAHGITTFTAEVLPSNHRMIEVFRQSGFAVEVRSKPDVITVQFPTTITDEGRAQFEQRDRLSARAAVSRLLAPRSVAVIGASRRAGTVGDALTRNLVAGGFAGARYAVNPHGGEVHGLSAYRSVAEIPEPVDLAVVAVPATEVVRVARECVAAGVRSLVVISAGFAETGRKGRRRQEELVAVCREAGVRLVGPNCLGVLNTAKTVQLNATFAPHRAPAGSIGFLSQSGGLGIAIIESASRLGVGLSSFVSVGNKADLSGNDFLQYWEDDEDTCVALLYLESFGNPRKFARVARRIARRKPIVAVKSGRSPAGVRGTVSHTGALLAASDVTVDALFAQAGVIRTDTLAEMFDVAALLAHQPAPAGDRVAIVTNAGGPGIVCADACQAAGIQVPELSDVLTRALAAELPAAASVANPVDMIATASADDYRRVLRRLADSDEVDAILAIFVPPLVTDADDVATAIHDVALQSPGCPIAAVFMTAERPSTHLSGDGITVPTYEFPEDAARAIARASAYGRWRRMPTGEIRRAAPAAVAAGASVISRSLGDGAGWMSPEAVWELLACHGIPTAPVHRVSSPVAAGRLAARLRGPVALKGVAAGLLHKRDAGAVVVDLHGARAVQRAAERMREAVAEAGFALEGYLVQPMVAEGVELLVGVVQDPSFGPVLACGAGGTTAELTRDVAVRITPVSDREADEMLRSLASFPLLGGYRGAPACYPTLVTDIIERVSAMVEAHPEIAELDCNPLVVRPDGATVVDARARLHPAAAPPPLPAVGR